MSDDFDPLKVLGALERHRVAYVLVGGLAGVLHGTDEIASAVEIVPQVKADNLERLERALAELGGRIGRRKSLELDANELVSAGVTSIATDAGTVGLVPAPAGTRGYEDLRRAASREPLGWGVRARVASVNDLARIEVSLVRDSDRQRLATLRRLSELGRGVHLEL